MGIEINHYTKILHRKTVLNNISLSFQKGHIYGLRGINGSGKTMLIRAICGLIYPTNGYVAINGEVLGKDISFPRSIGALIESPAFLPNYSGFDNLKMLTSIKNRTNKNDIESILHEVGLDSAERKAYRKYSLGMKQKLGIAAALVEKPDIIILDEPFNALDDISVKKTTQLIMREKERGAIVIIACHDASLLESIADEIVCIESGQIIKQIS